MEEQGAAGGGIGSPEGEGAESTLQMAVTVFRKLKDLDCPFLNGLYVSELSTIQELLCSPSKYRLEILEWMCVRICPSLQDKFSVLKGTQAEGKIQEMVKLGHELMLCGPDEQDLVKGFACAQRQLHFMDQMLDVIQNLCTSYPTCSSVEQHFGDTKEKNESLLGDLLSDPHLQSLLSPESDLLPVDIEHILDQKPGVTLEAEEEKQVAELARQLQESASKLLELQAEHKEGAAVVAGDLNTLEQRLRLVVSDFHQLILAFLQVYDDELGECCQRPGLQLHPCGPIIQAVYHTLTSCSQLLKAVMDVTDNSMRTENMAARQHNESICWGSNSSSVMSLATKMQELSQQYKLFSENLKKGPA